ncbi:hypothetical protein STRTUCAR8_03462 [Streptomyces turgidiscabies Car8]|uniref:Uncharacterized protein n=1 Tax=Streptomyces turgidiscabies (strain Car8) TaxID=698760 RepID=L7FHD1_STRT8|nr:hypothetical protein STRTUCAR8_03462 [Streptomyces turgidiscabies Car8]
MRSLPVRLRIYLIYVMYDSDDSVRETIMLLNISGCQVKG